MNEKKDHRDSDPEGISPCRPTVGTILFFRVLAQELRSDRHKGDHVHDEDAGVDPMQKRDSGALRREGNQRPDKRQATTDLQAVIPMKYGAKLVNSAGST